MGLKWAVCATVVTGLLSGCGGGGAGNGALALSGLPIFDPALAAAPQTLAVAYVNSGSGATGNQTTTLTGTTINGSIIAGTVDLTAGRINLAGGGSASVTTGAGGTQQFFFTAANQFGVAGVPTPTMPTGTTATYNGSLSAFIDDGAVAETLTGAVTVTADFNFNSVDVQAASISGATRSGSLTINNASISGSRINGGRLDLTGNFGVTLPNNAAVSHAGQFFGSGAQEVGGVFHLDQTGSGNALKILGSYSGN